jgi:hypothetical protein
MEFDLIYAAKIAICWFLKKQNKYFIYDFFRSFKNCFISAISFNFSLDSDIGVPK